MTKREILKDQSELKISVSIEGQDWKDAQAKAKKDLLKNLSIPGFRKGKVPAAKAEALINKAEVLRKACNLVLDKVEKLTTEQIMEDDKVLDGPSYVIDSVDEKSLEISAFYPVYPTIKIADYKKLKTKIDEVKVSKKDVDSQIDRILETNSLVVDAKGPVKSGNVVIFDFKGFIDDKPFDGGEAEDFELKIGSGNFIPGFEDALIGFKKGEKKDIFVKFPENYHAKEYAGKDARFAINLKEIKTFDKPKLDDSFVADLKIPNVNTVKELEKHLENLTLQEKEEQAKVKFQKEAFAEILKTTEVPVARKLIENETTRLLKQFESNLKQQGFNKKEYLELTKLTEEDLKSELSKEAVHNLKNAFVYAEISRLENIIAREEDYAQEYEKLAKLYGMDVESIKGVISPAQLQIPITNQKVIARLIEFSKGKTTKVKEEKTTEKKETKTKTTKKVSTKK